jgi:hypothetical protein
MGTIALLEIEVVQYIQEVSYITLNLQLSFRDSDDRKSLWSIGTSDHDIAIVFHEFKIKIRWALLPTQTVNQNKR